MMMLSHRSDVTNVAPLMVTLNELIMGQRSDFLVSNVEKLMSISGELLYITSRCHCHIMMT